MMKLLRAKAGRAATEAVRSTVRAALDVELQACLVLVPVVLTQTDCFEAHLGRIALVSGPGKPSVVTVSGTALKSSRFLGAMQERAGCKDILREWSGSIAVAKGAGGGMGPDLCVRCDADALRVQIDEEQLFLLFALLENNTWKPGRYAASQSNAALETTVDRVRDRLRSSSPQVYLLFSTVTRD
jgi:hypothetical protein